MARCTLDGIIDLTRNGFGQREDQHCLENFLPERKRRDPPPPADGEEPLYYYDIDFVHIWCLFRSRHSCFTHFDLHNDMVIAELQKRVAAWEHLFLLPAHDARAQLLAAGGRPPSGVTFVRTVIAENPLEELELLPALHDAFREKARAQNGLGARQGGAALDFRTVAVVHDQAPRTMPLCTVEASAAGVPPHPCVVWNLARDRGGDRAAASLFDQCHDGYQTILREMTKETRWKTLGASLPTLAQYVRQRRAEPFTPYRELSLIDGRVPAMRGSCKGVYSTLYDADGARPGCPHCGNTEGHPVSLYLPPEAAAGPPEPWPEAAVDLLLQQYAGAGGDEVAATEAAAVALHKSAKEVYAQLQQVLAKE
ncbi:hypothetical protein STCU_05724 [Strigomonas culicis]|nr:hypothetical protein STCU_05724 [Strigomonas culicis]|eukprot:EPY27491.1 hypothetical protein STCU_05724 [Strigomonas culicis]